MRNLGAWAFPFIEWTVTSYHGCGVTEQDNVDPVVGITMQMSDEWDRNFQSTLERSVMLCGL